MSSMATMEALTPEETKEVMAKCEPRAVCGSDAKGRVYLYETVDGIVIVARWADRSKPMGECFGDPNWAGLRWLQWQETFATPGDLPRAGDVVIQQDHRGFWVYIEGDTEAHGSVLWREVEFSISRYLRRQRQMGHRRKVWFHDAPYDNHYLWPW